MAKYQDGDVVLCKFPFQENPTKFKERPGLILKVVVVSSKPYFYTAMITSTTTNQSDYVGKIVLANSKEGKAMGLRNDSFIHLENVARLPDFGIIKLIGTCPIMTDLKALCTVNGILI